MASRAYYNEIDLYAAHWLRNLIAAGHIAPGDVDTRSIVEVRADDLKGYTQCHFFAGIGGWSHALRLAGWDDARFVWTGSCPCQPFSAAGKGKGTDDTRHLWPEWFRLIREHRPVAIFGEQASAAICHGWLDLVSTDLEGLGYALGSAVLGAHSVGAPHIRQRLYFVAGANSERRIGISLLLRAEENRWHGTEAILETAGRGQVSELVDSAHVGLDGRRNAGPGRGRESTDGSQLGHTDDEGSQRRRLLGTIEERNGAGECAVGSPGASFWSACDWIPCIDGKVRPVEPGTFPLAHGAPARVGRLRAYGNAIVAPLAKEFIGAYMGISV